MLELGCGDGGNVLSMAQTLPASSFLGIDIAEQAIARGSVLARAAGLTNVELHQGDLEALPDDLGSFDYIVAHGVYSWIPPGAREALLDCCRRRLNPAGIAFVSYNAYPGSYLRDMSRDILRFHLRAVDDPQQRLAAAQALMRTIVAIEEPTPFARVLREHMQRMLRVSDALLLHDDLAEISTPFYFHEFMEHARRHGLAFLSEADLFESQMRDLPAGVEQLMAHLPPGTDEVLEREQYLDFFKNRMFRQTLLCHAEAPVRRELDDRHLESMVVSSSVSRSTEQGAAEGETFVTAEGFSVTTSEPLVAAAMSALGQAWPAALDFSTLVDRASDAVGAGAPRDAIAARLRAVLLEAYLARIVQLNGSAPPLDTGVTERLCAGALSRAQCAAGSQVVSSLLHGNVAVADEREQRLLPLLDGTRDLEALTEAMGEPAATVEELLGRFAAVGLLMRSHPS